MVDWKQTVKHAAKIRRKFIEQLDDSMEPGAIISAALSIVYETQEIFDEDFAADFSTYSTLGQFLIEHADEKVSVEEAHGQVIFIAACGETIEVAPPIESVERLNYIR